MISDDRSRVWVKRLPDILKTLNNMKKRITGKEPDEAIKLKEVDIEPKNYQAGGRGLMRLDCRLLLKLDIY